MFAAEKYDQSPDLADRQEDRSLAQPVLQNDIEAERSLDLASVWRPLAHVALLSLAGASAAAGQRLAENTIPASPAPEPKTSVVPEAGAQAPQTPDRPFNIPAGDLATALDAYSHLTGIKVHSRLDHDKLAAFNTEGVRTTTSTAEALRRLLDGTGLSAHFEGPGRVQVDLRSAEHVDVTASVAQSGLQQFSQSLLDTAQTVSVVPQYIMGEQADTTLRDSLRNVPGISIAAGEGGAQGDNLTIRGFSARNDIFLDGIRDFGSYYRDSFDYGAVDVLEGPASVEFGRGSTGGVVNQESKVPELTPFAAGSLQLGTNAMRRLTADIDRPLAGIPGGTAFRVNAAAEETGVAGRAITETRRFGIAPSLAFGLNTRTRFNLSYLHEGENSTPDYGLPYFGASVAPVPRSTFYGFASDNYLRTSPDVVTARLDHDFGPHLTLRNTFRWGNYPRDVRITEPQINTAATLPTKVTVGAPITVQCAVGSTPASSCYTVSTPLSQIYVNRNQIAAKSVEDILWDQVSLASHFSLGHISNDVLVLAEGGRERSNPNRPSYKVAYVPALSPNPSDPFAPTSAVPGVTTHVASQSYGLNFLDTLQLTHWLQLSGGVRYDYFSTTSSSPANTAATPVTAATYGERLDKQPTYRAAVVYKPRSAGSVYFDWGTSFNPAAESLSLSGNNAISPPEYNETYELGAKWDFLHDRLNLNGSIFRTEKLNARETDPTNSLNIVNSGNQLVRGVQLGALGHLPNHFDLLLGYAYLDGRVESSILNASPFAAINNLLITAKDPRANTAPFYLNPAGFPLANVPRNSGNVWVTHSLPWRLVGGFGGSYVGARRASSTSMIGTYTSSSAIDPTLVPLSFKAISGYTLLNAMLRRPISDRLDFQVNVNNLTNAFFIDQPHPNHLVPGEGLNTQFGFNYKF